MKKAERNVSGKAKVHSFANIRNHFENGTLVLRILYRLGHLKTQARQIDANEGRKGGNEQNGGGASESKCESLRCGGDTKESQKMTTWKGYHGMKKWANLEPNVAAKKSTL